MSLRRKIDGLTAVPDDSFTYFMRAGKQIRDLGQHMIIRNKFGFKCWIYQVFITQNNVVDVSDPHEIINKMSSVGIPECLRTKYEW